MPVDGPPLATPSAPADPVAMDDGEDRKSLKKQKKEYKDEKKRVAAELVSALRDPTVVVMADWLKVRGTLRKWNRYWCVLKPGLMLIYRNGKTEKLSDGPKKEETEQSTVAAKDTDSLENIDLTDKRISETEAEKHFDGLDDQEEANVSDQSFEGVENGENGTTDESIYARSEPEQFGQLGDGAQTEEVGEENKSLVWSILKQVRPGMDLSKVVLPTFILEPRSFLEKLADFYYHADLLNEASTQNDPYMRMISVVKFYLSGFYKKPKGLKKPYNPILGETFRCCWQLPDGSTTYYIAEQVSHHPPISSLFVTNRKAGYNISGTILAKSKYYGNSLSAMMLGNIRLTLLGRGETYTVTLPYANCKGIMIGTLTMEYGGEVTIECDRTAYTCILDFKLKPFIGGSMNVVQGKVKFGKETLAEIDGRWDGQIWIKNPQTSQKEVLWNPTPDVIRARLPRFEIPLENQGEWESKRLWLKVSEAIAREDQYAATAEKTILEEEQRKRARSGIPHKPKFFRHNMETNTYDYIHAEYRPWDVHTDVRQVEHDYVVRTEQKIKASRSRQTAIANAPTITAVVVSDDASSESSERGERRRRHTQSPSTEQIETVLKPLQEMLEKVDISVRRLTQRVEALQAARPDLMTMALVFVVVSLVQTLILNLLSR